MARRAFILILIIVLVVGGLFFFNRQADPVPLETIETPVAATQEEGDA